LHSRGVLEVWRVVHVVFVSHGDIGFGLAGIWCFLESPAVVRQARPPMMSGEPPCTIKHPACSDFEPIAIVGEVLGL